MTLIIIPLNGVIGVTPIISRVILPAISSYSSRDSLEELLWACLN